MGRIFTAICVIAICFPVFARAIAIRAIDLNAILTLFVEQVVSVITQTEFDIEPQPEQPTPQPTTQPEASPTPTENWGL